jgi:hypothetical protein
MNTICMRVTPEAIQQLFDELEASKQSRLRACQVLQRLRAVLSDLGNVAIGPPKAKTFEAEGEILQRTLAKCLRERNEAIKGLVKTTRRFRDSIVKEDLQARLPARDARTVEGAGTGRGTDPELRPVKYRVVFSLSGAVEIWALRPRKNRSHSPPFD